MSKRTDILDRIEVLVKLANDVGHVHWVKGSFLEKVASEIRVLRGINMVQASNIESLGKSLNWSKSAGKVWQDTIRELEEEASRSDAKCKSLIQENERLREKLHGERRPGGILNLSKTEHYENCFEEWKKAGLELGFMNPEVVDRHVERNKDTNEWNITCWMGIKTPTKEDTQFTYNVTM